MIVVDGDRDDVVPGIDLRLAADTHTFGSMYVTVRNDGARESQDAWVFAGDNVYTSTISPGSIRTTPISCRSAWPPEVNRICCSRARRC